MRKYKQYLVGGAVRDKLLGIPCKDFDYAVEAPSYAAMKEDILAQGVTIFQEREEFLTIRGSHPVHGGVDYVLCRKDGNYSDGRRPDEVVAGTLMDDLKRRDFTVNAMAIDEETGELIDPFDGQGDLRDKILRCVGETSQRFDEDYLRVIRAARFAITKGFNLSDEIEYALVCPRTLANLTMLAQHRVYEELEKCFKFSTFKSLSFFMEHPFFLSTIFAKGMGCGMELEAKGPAGIKR